MSTTSAPTIAELASLQAVINGLDELPYCTGTVALDTNASTLFYQSGDLKAELLDFTQATDQQLDNLARACNPATFGRNQQDVLDESYRKAGKMDANRFATQFSPADSGIPEIVSDLLLRGRVQQKAIRLELYKLNVYGPGGFFKAHVDTPRSDTMFASLVVVLPTVHEGGSLIIRHNEKEWTFDSAKAVNTESTPHAAFVAFFSDVEHEVTPVISGYRVTLTYNLYFKKSDKADSSSTVSTFGQTDAELGDALGLLLKNPAFLPNGGVLGFGLAHKYPFNQASTDLSTIGGSLKGTDAAIKRACDTLSLPVAVKAVYRERWDDSFVLLDHFADFGTDQIESRLTAYLKKSDAGQVIYNFGENPPQTDSWYHPEEDKTAIPMVWVKPLAKANTFISTYMHYGNEASIAYAYGEICLVATVPPAKERNN